MSRINQDPTFSAQRTLLSQGGSTVQFGDFLVIPIDDSFLYEVPVYVRAVQEAAVPELKQVIIVNGSQGQVSLGNDLDTALRDAVTGLPPTGGGNGGGNPPPTGACRSRSSGCSARRRPHFQNAQAALTGGDLATYQSEINAAQQDVDAGREAVGTEPDADDVTERVALGERLAVRLSQSGSRKDRSAETSITSICAFCRRPE